MPKIAQFHEGPRQGAHTGRVGRRWAPAADANRAQLTPRGVTDKELNDAGA
jgi:hypothetical protein